MRGRRSDPVANQDYFLRDLPAKFIGTARVELLGLAPGRYALEVTRVGYRQNDVHSAYADLGRPPQLTRHEVEALRSMSDGSPLLQELVAAGADGRIVQDLELRENDVYLLRLTLLRGAAGE